MTERELFDPAELGPKVYPLLNAVVVPRPIAWVCSQSAAGEVNLAPHSYFTVASVQPPVVQFTSVGDKDTLRNILATGEFVVCLTPRRLVHAVNVSGVPFPAGESELERAGLHAEPSARVGPPRVAESPVAIECRLRDTYSFGPGEGAATLVFGDVLAVAVARDALIDGLPDIRRLDPISRLGGADYATIGEVLTVPRMSYLEWQALDTQ